MTDLELLHIITMPTRYQILMLLLNHHYCGKALSAKLGISESAVSQHLQVLKNCGLVTVGHNRFVAQYKHRSIDDETRVRQLAWIKCLGADAFPIFHKNTVAAVLAASHDEVGSHRPGSVRCFSNDDTSSRVCVCL